jgi:hypothetical protein
MTRSMGAVIFNPRRRLRRRRFDEFTEHELDDRQ